MEKEGDEKMIDMEKTPAGGGRTVAVTGAAGFIGRRLCAALRARGYRVRALVSPTGDESPLIPLDVEIHKGALRDTEAIARLVDGAQGVFHLAGIVGRVFKLDAEYWDVNVTATKELLGACAGHGVKRFVYCSTADVCGHIENPPGDENSPLASDDIYQITKGHGEKVALSANGKKGLEVTVVRPSKVYGPGDPRRRWLFRNIANGSITIFGDGESLIHPVYVDDLVDGLILAYQSQKTPGRIYIIAGEKCLTINEMVGIIAGAAGVTARRRYFPYFPAKVYSFACEKLFTFFGLEPPIFRRNVDFFIKNHCYNIDRARDELGYQPKTGFAEGARKTIEWYREKGLL